MSEEDKRTLLSRSLIVVLCGAVLVTAGARFGIQDQQPQTPFQVGGILLDATSRFPVADGVVAYSCWGPEGPIRDGMGLEGPNASFVIRDLPRCALYIVARAPGYGGSVAFAIADPQAITEIEFFLPRAGALSGMLLDANGLPVTGAEVVVTYLDSLKDRLSYGADLVQQARDEGLRIFMFEAPELHHGSPYTDPSEGKAAGVFTILNIDPERPFRLVARHREFGELVSPVMTLNPGERVSGFRLQYQ